MFVVVIPFSALMLFWAISGLCILIALLSIGMWRLLQWLLCPQSQEPHRQDGIDPSVPLYASMPAWRQPWALKNYKEITPGHWRQIDDAESLQACSLPAPCRCLFL
jgi:hypothetical protein